MAKTIWIKDSGVWKRVTSVWTKNAGVWNQINVNNGPLPFGINGNQSFGGAGTFTVPDRIYRLSVTCNAGCMRGSYGLIGAKGGIVRAVFDVTPGEVFSIRVAPGGNSRGSSGTSSGNGGNALVFGLGPSEVWLVAGAPGGYFFENPPGSSTFYGGEGGGTTGGTGAGSGGSVGGGGGGQSAGGTPNGAFLQGGDAGSLGGSYYGGGGGGGYYGGGGGDGPAQWGQSGGGGSSYGNIPSGRNGNVFDNTQSGGYFGGENIPISPSIYINY
jgi:hypothetical protein